MVDRADGCALCGREWGFHGKRLYKDAPVCDSCDKRVEELVLLCNNGNDTAAFLLHIADLKAQGIPHDAFGPEREPECIRYAKERWR